GICRQKMAKSSKLVASKNEGVFLVRRRRDKLWMFPGGRKRGRETEKQCLLREINEEYVRLPDDCDPLPGGFVTIRRTISIDCTSFVCKYPSAAATRSATRSKNEDGDRPTSGRKASTITFALPRSSISRTRLSKASIISR